MMGIAHEDRSAVRPAPGAARRARPGTDTPTRGPPLPPVNASAIAPGHYIGDTGDFGNALYTGIPMLSGNGSPVAGMENDTVLAEMNQKFGGNYLNEESLLARARAEGFSTAVIGK